VSVPAEAGPKIYEVTNRYTGDKHFTVAYDLKGACARLGWQIDDCYIYEVKPKFRKILGRQRGLLVYIPCRVCFYQYAECRLPTGQQCPCKPTSPELQEWIKQATAAHLCNHVGQSLSHKDYEKQIKWLPLSEAIEELAPQP